MHIIPMSRKFENLPIGLNFSSLLLITLTSVAMIPHFSFCVKVSVSDSGQNPCLRVYNESMYEKLTTICEDCYNVMRESVLLRKCRENCFHSEFFNGCLDVLLMSKEEIQEIKSFVRPIDIDFDTNDIPRLEK